MPGMKRFKRWVYISCAIPWPLLVQIPKHFKCMPRIAAENI